MNPESYARMLLSKGQGVRAVYRALETVGMMLSQRDINRIAGEFDPAERKAALTAASKSRTSERPDKWTPLAHRASCDRLLAAHLRAGMHWLTDAQVAERVEYLNAQGSPA